MPSIGLLPAGVDRDQTADQRGENVEQRESPEPRERCGRASWIFGDGGGAWSIVQLRRSCLARHPSAHLPERAPMFEDGRGDWIRTSDPHTPSVMRYQAALRPDRSHAHWARESGASSAARIAWQGGLRRDRRPATSCALEIPGAPSKKRISHAMTTTSLLAAAAPSAGASFFVQTIPLVLVFVIFWFLLIRPQQKRMKEHQAQIAGGEEGRPRRHRRRPDRQGDQGRRYRGRSRAGARASGSRWSSRRLSQVVDPDQRSRPTTDVRFSPLEGVAGQPDRFSPAFCWRSQACCRRTRSSAGRHGCRALESTSGSTSPAAASCCWKPTSATPPSSGCRPRKRKLRPSFAAASRASQIGDVSTAGGRLSFVVRDPTQLDAAFERHAHLDPAAGPDRQPRLGG